MIKVNLLPKEFQDRGKGLDWVILGYGVMLLLAMVGMTSYGLQMHSYKKNLRKKARWSQQLSEIKAKVAQVEALDAQKNVLNAKKNTVVQLFQARILYPRLLESLYAVLPRDVWLTDVTASEDAQKNIKVIAQSSSLNTDAIADWLQSLESKTDKFSDVSLSAIEARPSPDAKSTTFAFSMSFTYHPPTEAAPGS